MSSNRELIDYVAKIYKIFVNSKYFINIFLIIIHMPYIALESLIFL